jgi:hypothetical protein
MKIEKLHAKSRVLQVLLGMAVAGALLFAACQNIFDMPGQTQKDDGYGTVVVNLGDEARTLYPDLNQFLTAGGGKIIFTFISKELDLKQEFDTSQTGANLSFRLPEGRYELGVKAYTSANVGNISNVSATGKYRSADGTFLIEAGKEVYINVNLEAVQEETLEGTLTVRIILPASGAEGTFKLTQYSGPDPDDDYILGVTDFSVFASYDTSTTTTPAFILSGNGLYISELLPVGTYVLTGKITTTDAKYGGFSEAIHIAAYAETKFERDFRDTASLTGVLAKITKPEEAYALLRDDIEDWITSGALAAVGGIDKGNAGNSYNNNTIKLYYVAERSQGVNAGTGAINGGNFPLSLKGGWNIDTTGYPSDNLSVGNNLLVDKEIHLINASVKTNAQAANPDAVAADPNYGTTTYIVTLTSVAEYNVTYGPGAFQAGRDITITDANGLVTLSPATGNVLRSGRGLAGVTAIGVTNGAITVNQSDSYVVNDTTNNVTPDPTMQSREYNIVIYKKAAEQVMDAYNALVQGIAPNRGVANGAAAADPVPWIASTVISALTTNDWQIPDPATYVPITTPVANNAYDPVTLFYVESRLNGNTQFELAVPTNRWGPGEMNVTVPTTNLSVGSTKTIAFTPYGGGSAVQFSLKLRPVAEFYVDFRDIQPTNTQHKLLNTGSLKIKDLGTVADGSLDEITFTKQTWTAPATDPNLDGKRFMLGATIGLTLADVTIMVNETDVGADIAGQETIPNTSFDDEVDFTTVPITATVNSGTGVPVIQNGPYNVATPASREYKVRVYPSIAAQRQFAVDKLSPDVNSKPARWLTNAGSQGRLEDFATITGAGTPPIPTSKMEYVINNNRTNTTATGPFAAPVFDTSAFPGNDTSVTPNWVSPYSDPVFWSDIDASASLSAANGNRIVEISCTLYGGFEEVVYNFNVMECAEYRLRSAPLPMKGTGYQTTGTLTVGVAAGNPGLGTAATIPAYSMSATPSDYILIGTGSATPNSLVVTGGGSSLDQLYINSVTTTGVTTNTNNTGAVTIAAPTSTTYEFIVYPSRKAQTDSVLAYMRTVKSLDSWGASIKTVADPVVDTTNASSNTSTFQVVGDLSVNSGAPLYVNGPTATADLILNDDYSPAASYLALTQAVSAGPPATTLVDANGNKDVRVTYTVFGAASTPAAGETQDYLLKLIAVARYTVQFMAGPILPADQTIGDIVIRTLAPGTNALKTTSDSTTQLVGDPRVFIGGIGDTTDGGNIVGGGTISSVGQNVFRLGTNAGTTTNPSMSGNPAYTNGANSTIANRVISLGTAVTSGDYLIEVYPTVTAQTKQVTDKLATIATPYSTPSGDNSSWLTYTGTTILGAGDATAIKPLAATSFSEVQYRGADPTVKVANNFIVNKTKYPSSSTDPGLQVGTTASGVTQLNFIPIGATLTNPNVWSFRLIPLAKYTVEYSNGAMGTVTIAPQAANTPIPNGVTTSIIPDIQNPPPAQPTPTNKIANLQIGNGQVVISINASPNQFWDVTVMDSTGSQVTNGKIFSSNNEAGGANPAQSVTLTGITTTSGTSAKPGEYTIRVFQKDGGQ